MGTVSCRSFSSVDKVFLSHKNFNAKHMFVRVLSNILRRFPHFQSIWCISILIVIEVQSMIELVKKGEMLCKINSSVKMHTTFHVFISNKSVQCRRMKLFNVDPVQLFSVAKTLPLNHYHGAFHSDRNEFGVHLMTD